MFTYLYTTLNVTLVVLKRSVLPKVGRVGQSWGFECGRPMFKSPTRTTGINLSLVIPGANSPRFVNSQLVCLGPPVGILNWERERDFNMALKSPFRGVVIMYRGGSRDFLDLFPPRSQTKLKSLYTFYILRNINFVVKTYLLCEQTVSTWDQLVDTHVIHKP